MNKSGCITTVNSLCLLMFIISMGCASFAAGSERYAIIVNNKVEIQSDTDSINGVLKRLFLKQQTQWPNGINAKPFGRNIKSREHLLFCSEVLNMDERELADHWMSMKQRTGETPPHSVSSDRLLVRLIEKYEGAFGIVNETVIDELPENIRVLSYITAD